jgi:hypothetical protein
MPLGTADHTCRTVEITSMMTVVALDQDLRIADAARRTEDEVLHMVNLDGDGTVFKMEKY